MYTHTHTRTHMYTHAHTHTHTCTHVYTHTHTHTHTGFPGGSESIESACNAGDTWDMTFMRAPPLWPNHLPKTPPPKTIPLGTGVSTYDWAEGKTHSVPTMMEVIILVTWGRRCVWPKEIKGTLWGAGNVLYLALSSGERKWKSLGHVWLFAIPMDSSPPGSYVHGILQARILEWVAIPFCT